MRVGLNIRCLQRRRTGVGTYAYNLLREMAALAPEHEYIAFSYTLVQDDFGPGVSKVAMTHRKPSFTANLVWEQAVLPVLARSSRLSVLHGPAFMAPIVCSVPRVVTFHDTAFLKYPQTQTLAFQSYYRWMVPTVGRRADHIITVSHSAQHDVLEFLEVPPDKVSVIYNGVSEQFHPRDREQCRHELERRWPTLKSRYLLYVGTIEPRKNIIRLLEAYALLRRRTACDHQLVLAGGKGWRYDSVFKAITDLRIESNVVVLDYVPEALLPALYCAADLFVYPSLYEGFGLPPLEAMACGTPVIVSNTSSLPEVVGDAGVQVNPDDAEQLARAIETVLGDESLSKALSEKGLARAAKFSWRRAALETLKVYQRVASGG